MRISDWSSDVCSSDLNPELPDPAFAKIVILTGGAEEREVMVGKIRRMIAQNSFPEARMRVSRLSMGPPVPYPVSFRLIGPDIAELRRLVLPMREIKIGRASGRERVCQYG